MKRRWQHLVKVFGPCSQQNCLNSNCMIYLSTPELPKEIVRVGIERDITARLPSSSQPLKQMEDAISICGVFKRFATCAAGLYMSVNDKSLANIRMKLKRFARSLFILGCIENADKGNPKPSRKSKHIAKVALLNRILKCATREVATWVSDQISRLALLSRMT